MTDNVATHYEGLYLPHDLWQTIASFLDNEDSAKFRQLCKDTQFVGSQVSILQPLYNRLYAMDKTLPPLLPQEGALATFQQAFEKIQTRQKSEIDYLTQHHPDRMAKLEYEQTLKNGSVATLKSLETRHTALNNINTKIIEEKIDLNKTRLNLDMVYITRLPLSLFQEPVYLNFWKNLTYLTCKYNQLTELNVQELTALRFLFCTESCLSEINVQGLATLKFLCCENNQLTELNLQGLTALEWLICPNNQITELNVQGLATLKLLYCPKNQLKTLDVKGLLQLRQFALENNPLEFLNLTGVHADIKNKYAELEKSLLFKQLSLSDSDETRQAIMARLGTDYTYANCLKYCPVYAAKLFACDSANTLYDFASTALSRASAFLPSFGGSNNASTDNADLKRKRDKTEEPGDEPDPKRLKKG